MHGKATKRTTYLTLNVILQYVLLTSPLPEQQTDDDVKPTNWARNQAE